MLVNVVKYTGTNGIQRTQYILWCPGCKDIHAIDDNWQFDGNLAKPTFSPSILTWEGNWPDRPAPNDKRPLTKCHSFVRDGQWHFLSDCTHKLANKTVKMKPLPKWASE